MELSIGQVAAAGSVNVQTIRYYERRGLLLPVRRTKSRYRQYSQESVTRLRFIRHAQELGFALKEIEDLLALRVRAGASCDAVADRTRKKMTPGRCRSRPERSGPRHDIRAAPPCVCRRNGAVTRLRILYAAGREHQGVCARNAVCFPGRAPPHENAVVVRHRARDSVAHVALVVPLLYCIGV